MASPVEPQWAPLTAANLRRLAPSLIQPMPPMSISSGGDLKKATDDHNHEDHDAKVVRLQSWVYNAMQTLVGLGAQGLAILNRDELVITGLGRIGPRPGALPNADVNSCAYLEEKLAYLEAKCKPLSQERRRRRRMATREEARAEDEARALAEARAIKGNASVNMRGGDGTPSPDAHKGPSTNVAGPRISTGYPTEFTDGLHGGPLDDGKSYYYETLRNYLRRFCSEIQTEALIQSYGACGRIADANDDTASGDPLAKIVDTADMPITPRKFHLEKQAGFLANKISELCGVLSHKRIEVLLVRHLPLSGPYGGDETGSAAYNRWLASTTVPHTAAQCWYVPFGLIGEHGVISATLLDYVEASQGLLFRVWLDAAPAKVGEVLREGPLRERSYVCKLLAAALLDPAKALEALVQLGRSKAARPGSASMQAGAAGQSDTVSSRVLTWLDNIPAAPSTHGRRPQAARTDDDDNNDKHSVQTMRRQSPDAHRRPGPARAAAVDAALSHPAPLSAGSSVMEISPDEFARLQQQQSQSQETITQRGGWLDEPGDKVPGEAAGRRDIEPESPPAKRAKHADPQSTPSLQHDPSVHESTVAATTTEQMADTPISQPVHSTSTTDAPQSSASSTRTLAAEGGKGTERVAELSTAPASRKRSSADVS